MAPRQSIDVESRLHEACGGIVGDLVIVPDRNHRIELVQTLEIGIGTIGGEPLAVPGQGHRLVHRQQAIGQALLGAGIFAALVLIVIVAEVNREVEVPRLAGVAIGVEPAEAIVGAGKHRQLEARQGRVIARQ